jgi:hypothetical protein
MIVDDMDYEQIRLCTPTTLRFAYSLAGKADEASELTQKRIAVS